MSVFTKRKVTDLIIGQDNVLDLNTLSAEVKIYTNCVETYVTKQVEGGKVTLTADDIDYLNNGLISFTDGKFTSSTDYYIPNELNGCTDINAANISKLREKINNLGGGGVDLSAVYGEINTLNNRLTETENSLWEQVWDLSGRVGDGGVLASSLCNVINEHCGNLWVETSSPGEAYTTFLNDLYVSAHKSGGGDVDLSAIYGRLDEIETWKTSISDEIENQLWSSVSTALGNAATVRRLFDSFEDSFLLWQQDVNANITPITQEEYDQLVSSGQIQNDRLYFIK